VLFMAVIAAGGNYAFLNHLTAVPMLVALDDAFLRGVCGLCLGCVRRMRVVGLGV
jgi:hypothetical protein